MLVDICSIILAVLISYKFRGSILLFLFSLINILFVLENYGIHHNNLVSFVYTDFTAVGYSENISYQLLIFNITLYFGVFRLSIGSLNFQTRPRFKVWLVLYFTAWLILFFGQQGSSLLSGSYGDSSKSVVYEYFILIIVLLHYYAREGALFKGLMNVLMFTYVLKSLLYGGRIEVTYVVLFWLYIKSINGAKFTDFRLVALMLVPLFVLSNMIGFIRSDPTVLLRYDLWDLIFRDRSSISTQGDVIYSSMRLVGLVDIGEIEASDRFLALLAFFGSVFIPRMYLSPLSTLSTYKKDFYVSGGGGLIHTHFYVWFGLLGPLLLALFLVWLVRRSISSKDSVVPLYFIMVMTTFPRWYAYNPILLFKMNLAIVPLKIFIDYLSKRKS